MQQKKILTAKKGQEEMVGFVLIMLLVSVIFMVFLGIFIRQGKTPQRDQNAEISQFLDSALDFTTECTLDNWHYLDVAELIAKYDSGYDSCLSGKKMDGLLKSTLANLTESSWNFPKSPSEADTPNKGYVLEIKRSGTNSPLLPPLLKASGCSSYTGAEKSVFSSSGTPLTISLKICLN